MAYFSAEFGIHESVPIYSGGLGLLAGDHLKSASDLGIPLVGVGLMYREGYFRQYLNVDGWQQERYPENDFFNLPLIPETNPDGTPAAGQRDHAGPRRVDAHLANSGRPHSAVTCSIRTSRRTVPTTGRSPPDFTAAITTCASARKWFWASAASAPCARMGKQPAVCHMNEGHSAFCGLERIRQLMEEYGLDYAAAKRGGHGRHLLHDAHARAGRQRHLRAAAHPALLRQLLAAAQDRLGRVSGSGPTNPQRPATSRSA